MPDTFSHIVLPYIFKPKYSNSIFFICLLFGTVLPDYFRELFNLALPQIYYGFTLQFHSLIGGFAVSLLMASFFINSQRVYVFKGIYSGYILHLFFDLLQFYPCGSSIFILFPFPYNFNNGLVNEADWIHIFLFSSSLFTIYLLYKTYMSIWRK